jgi:hypothetical protein
MATETPSLSAALHLSQQLSPSDQLRLIELVSEQLRHTLDTDDEMLDLLTSAGLGAEIWRQVDVDSYLAAERASWEH